ncbi:MAG: HYR domain-containing protein [Bacteroidetes bacterium]|nr:HYR domain-containing protein [Bacteroidota bacterium]
MKNDYREGRDMVKLKKLWFLLFCFTANVTILQAQCEDCPEPIAYTLDACACRESNTGTQGNATTLNNGQFTETLVVESEAGESWKVLEVNGFYHQASPQPPLPPFPYAEGNEMLEADLGYYLLKGLHIDGVGYSISLSNGVDTLQLNNVCAYPEPIMDPLAAGYCESSEVQELQGNGNGAEGEGIFDILDASDGSILVPNALVFDPAALGIGQYEVQYTFDQTPDQAPCTYCEPGCVQAVSQQLEVASQAASMDCNNVIQISLDEDCMEVLHPDVILEGSYDSYSIFEVHIFDGINDLGDVVNASMVGQTLNVQITNTCDENSCWSQIIVYDKLKPVIDCPEEPIQISCLEDPATVPPPTATDNCDGFLNPTVGAQQVQTFDCLDGGDFIKIITKKWQAVDASGNSAVPCNQIIEVLRPQPELIVFPPDLDDEDALSCGDDQPGPDISGYPTINGLPLYEGESVCQLNVTWSDVILEGCGDSYKILRKWTIYNWCQPEEILIHSQFIHLADQEPPLLNCPDSLAVSINGPGCVADFFFPEIDAQDACSPFELNIIGLPGGASPAGVFLQDVPAGIYDLTIEATDECGNESDCSLSLHIIDASAPVAICDEFTTISLDAQGVAELPAVELDDGSYDFCTEVSFAARRMDSNDDFTPTVFFDCADIANNNILVQVQVEDTFGNANQCMVEVEVEDKLAPVIECPEYQVIDCGQAPMEPSAFGDPIVTEPCGYDLDVVVVEDLNDCGIGKLNFNYTAVDPSGNAASCAFVVEVEDPLPFGESDILWPEDYLASSCDSTLQLHPDSLPVDPVNYGYPEFLPNDCSLTGISYEDAYFELSDTACFKIIRTWSVIDWCQFDPNTDEGIWTHEQVIKVIDNQAPEVFCAFSTFVKITSPVCYETVTLNEPFVTDCSPNLEVDISSDLGEGYGPFPNVPLGDYNVEYVVTDQCGNATYCSYILHVVDAKKPTPVCMNGAVIEMSEDGFVEVNVHTFNLGSYDNCTAPEDLLLTFTGQFADTVQTFTCDDIGPQELTLWVFDEAWNFDYCTFTVFVQDNLGHCDPENLSIAGQILTETDEPVAEVEVDLNQGLQPAQMVGPDGLYGFYDLAAGGDYTVTPSKDIGPLNGVTTYDMLLISMHILGLQTLDSPYKLIAADVNNSGTITTLDALQIQKLIIQEISEFPGNDSWRFVDAAYVFPNPQNPFDPPFPEVFSVNDLSTDITDADFIGVKIGDVNNSADPLNLDSAGDRQTYQEAWLEIPDRVIREGEQVLVEVILPTDLVSWQQELNWDKSALELKEILPFGEWASATQKMAGSIILTGIQFPSDVLESGYQLQFIAKGEARMSEVLRLAEDSENIQPEAINQQGESVNLKLRFADSKPSDLMVYPNPGKGEAIVSFKMEIPGMTEIRLLDIRGQEIWRKQIWSEAGSQEIIIPASHLSTSGLYLMELKTGETLQSKRIMRN